MDTAAVLAAYEKQLRHTPRAPFERAGAVIRCASEYWYGIVWAEVDESTADEVIAEQVRYFSGLGREFEWKYYSHDRPADLPERLRRAGFQPGPEESLMIAEVADLPLEPVLPDGVRLVAVTDAEGLRMLNSVHDAVFGETHRIRLDELAEVTPVLAMAGDVPVSGSRIDFHDGTEFASLWGGGTLEAWRGKGIYRAMVSYRARLAARRGARYLQVDALPTSRPILERLGFVRLSSTVPYTFSPR